MSFFLTGNIATVTINPGSPPYQIPVGHSHLHSRLLVRAEDDNVWITSFNNAGNWPAAKEAAFRLLKGVEYPFRFPRAQVGDEDPNLYAVSTASSSVMLSWIVIYEDGEG